MQEDSLPRRVMVAVWLYLSSIALGILSSAVVPAPGPLWFAVLIIIVMLLLALAIWRRQNWSRFVFLVLFLLGLPIMFAIREMLAQRGAFGAAILIAQTVLQGIALVLLFTGDSGAWYRRKAVTASQPHANH